MKYIHSEIKNKEIRSVHELSAAFDLFASDEAGIDGDLLWSRIAAAILTRHGEAERILTSNHPLPIWKLNIDGFYFFYQVLFTAVEVGDIVSAKSGAAFLPTQDLLAEFTAEEAV